MDGFNHLPSQDLPIGLNVTTHGQQQQIGHGPGIDQGHHGGMPVATGPDGLSLSQNLNFQYGDINVGMLPTYPNIESHPYINVPNNGLASSFTHQFPSEPSPHVQQTNQSSTFSLEQYQPYDGTINYPPSLNNHHTLHQPTEENRSSGTNENQMLCFSEPIHYLHPVCPGRYIRFDISAELNGMFFVAENVFQPGNPTRPVELTCYRRNLWQCSASLQLSRHLPQEFRDDNGMPVTVIEYFARLSGTESIEGKPAEIICVPWKNTPGNGMLMEESRQVAGPPPDIALNLAFAKDVDETFVVFPLVWKRLQFKHATANNGRRKGTQQNYSVHISLWGKTPTGELLRIIEVKSSPVIVRGRSPRNFDPKKDQPPAADKKEKKASIAEADVSASNLTTPQLTFSATEEQFPDFQSPPQAQSTSQSHQPHAKRVALSPGYSLGQQSSVPNSDTDHGGHSASPAVMAASTDDNTSSNAATTLDVSSPRHSKASTTPAPSATAGSAEDPDMLYEYFPLSVNDWMPPVDAVYRPHVVHHTIITAEIKAQQMQNSSKRYFAPD